MTPEQQLSLVQKIQQGDRQAFSRLYDFFIRPIYNFIYYKTHHKETAEDLTSQTFMKALGNVNSFNPNKGPFSAWLYQIARNLVIDYYRAQKSFVDIEDAWDINDNSDIERDVHNRVEFEKVARYLHALNSEQRDVITMRVWQELSYAEIAAALGKSEASCKMTFSRAIAKLRANMPLAAFVVFAIHNHL